MATYLMLYLLDLQVHLFLCRLQCEVCVQQHWTISVWVVHKTYCGLLFNPSWWDLIFCKLWVFVTRWLKFWIFPWSSYFAVPIFKHFFHCVLPTQLLSVNQHNQERCNRSASCSDSWAYFLLEPLWISEWQVMLYDHCSVSHASGVLRQAFTLKVLWPGWPPPLGSLLQTGTGSKWQLYSGWSKGTWFS